MTADRVQGFISLAICRELEQMLLRAKFGLSPAQVTEVVALVQQTFLVVAPVEQIRVVDAGPDDDMALEAAVAAQADAVVSGDRHLLSLGNFRDWRILSPRAFPEEMPELGGPVGR